MPLPDICSAALKLRHDEQEAARQRAGDRWQPSDLVFTTKWGTPIEPRNFNRSFDARCTKAGVPRIRVHDTRHTCASILAALDVHPRVAMRILRHAQISMTMEVYTEVPDKITRAALKKLGDSLGGQPPASSPGRRTGPVMTARADRGDGGALLTVASGLLLLLAAAQGYVSFRAQYTFVDHAKHSQVPSTLEALGLDTGAVIFALLALSLARRGRRATRRAGAERRAARSAPWP